MKFGNLIGKKIISDDLSLLNIYYKSIFNNLSPIFTYIFIVKYFLFLLINISAIRKIKIFKLALRFPPYINKRFLIKK